MTRVRALAAITAAGVTAGMVLATVPAHAATADTVLSINGGATIANAPYTVSAVKLSDVLGSTQTEKVVSSGTASSTGSFNVQTSQANTLDYTGPGGWVDFETKVIVNGEPRYTFSSRRWDATAARWSDTDGAAGGTTQSVDFAQSQPADTTDGDPMTGVQTTDAALASTSKTTVQPSAQTLASEVPCTWYMDASGYANTKVGEFHTGYDTTGYFTYGQTADSTISVGYNYGSSWTLSGAKQVSNSNSSYVRWNRSANQHTQLKSQFKYLRYHLTLGPSCTSSSSNFGKRWYRSTPYSWYTGTTVGNTVAGPFCSSSTGRVTFSRNTEYYRGKNRAYTYGGAASAFGAALSATSGFSTNVDMNWKFGSGTAAGHYLCGNPDVTTSKIVYAR